MASIICKNFPENPLPVSLHNRACLNFIYFIIDLLKINKCYKQTLFAFMNNLCMIMHNLERQELLEVPL